MRKDVVGPGNGPDLDLEDIGKADAVIVAQEHQLAIDLGKGSPVGHPAVEVALFETEDGAIWRVAAEDANIAGFVKVRDAALLVKPGVELLRGGQLDEFARHDEDQLAAGLEVADALFDEEQKKIAAPVEQRRFELLAGTQRDILKADVGWVADDAVELLAEREIEEIEHPGAVWRDAWVNFDTEAICLAIFQFGEKCAVTGRRFQHSTRVPAQVEHEAHHIGRRENLAELGDVAGRHALLGTAGVRPQPCPMNPSRSRRG